MANAGETEALPYRVFVSYSHTDPDIDRTVKAIHASLLVYKRALAEGVEKYLSGRPLKPVFRRLN